MARLIPKYHPTGMTSPKKKYSRRTIVVPLALLVYLAVLAWMGRGHLVSGHHLYYFGVIGASLLIILVLFFVLRWRDRIRQRSDIEDYGTYKDEKKE